MTKSKKSQIVVGTLAILMAALTAATVLVAQEGKTLKDVYNDSVKLYNAGQYAEALKGFELVLEKQPRYVYARNYAVKCRNAIQEGKKPTINLEKQLASIKIPSVDFNKTDLGTVLEYLTAKTDELSGGKVSANIIYQGTDEDRKNKLVTLSLRNVPVTEVITYVGRLTATKFKYEQYAIVGTPIGAGTVNPGALQPVTTEKPGAPKFDIPAPPDPFKK